MQVEFFTMLERIVSCRNIDITVLKDGYSEKEYIDLGIRHALSGDRESIRLVEDFYRNIKAYAICFVTDYFDTEYCVMAMPEQEHERGDYIVLGPYRDSRIEEESLQEFLQTRWIPKDYINELREYYHAIPVVLEIDQWRTLCIAMYRTMCEDRDIRIEFFGQMSPGDGFYKESTDEELSYRMVEMRYENERKLLKMVSSGNVEGALKVLALTHRYDIGDRYRDPFYNYRSGMVILNTLYRKAVEESGVHPVHIDRLSGQFAKQIEIIAIPQEAHRLMAEMTRKYCMLVQNYSLKGCSPVVQRVANYINFNISENISLKMLAEVNSVNASYLSTLFKKEMNMTVTDYINQQRIRYAMKLFNSSDMQVQEVASECGLYDVNYFRRLFKRFVGKTPSEYIKIVRGRLEG